MPARTRNYEHFRGKGLLYGGALLFIVGLLLNMGYSWGTVFEVAGVLIFLKGLFVKFMKK